MGIWLGSAPCVLCFPGGLFLFLSLILGLICLSEEQRGVGGVNFPAKRWNGDGGVGVGAFLQQSQVSPLQPWFLRSQHSRWTDFHGNNVSHVSTQL